MTVSWALLTSDSSKGYSTTDPVYTLQVDLCGRQTSGTLDYITLLETTSATSFLLSSQTPGSICHFRIFVNNIIGQSPYSELLEVLFAVEPDQ